MIRRLSRTVWAIDPRGLAPTTATEAGANSGRRSMDGNPAVSGAVTSASGAAAPGAGSPASPVVVMGATPASADDRVDAALLERAGDDQPLDLAGAFPDPVDPQLPQVPLGGELAHVAPAAEHLDRAIRAPP